MSCGVLLCIGGSGRLEGQEMVSGAGRVRIQARGLDGVRTELTPQPSKIHKWTEASDGTGLESETCSRLTRSRGQLSASPTVNKLLEET